MVQRLVQILVLDACEMIVLWVNSLDREVTLDVRFLDQGCFSFRHVSPKKPVPVLVINDAVHPEEQAGQFWVSSSVKVVRGMFPNVDLEYVVGSQISRHEEVVFQEDFCQVVGVVVGVRHQRDLDFFGEIQGWKYWN